VLRADPGDAEDHARAHRVGDPRGGRCHPPALTVSVGRPAGRTRRSPRTPAAPSPAPPLPEGPVPSPPPRSPSPLSAPAWPAGPTLTPGASAAHTPTRA